MNSGYYSIGSDHWPGVSKLIEEMGEVQQVLGKLLGTNGEAEHWDGTNLYERLEDELGDLLAAIEFFTNANPVLDYRAIEVRATAKCALFYRWHGGDDAARMSPPPAFPYDPKFILRRSLTQSLALGSDRVYAHRPDGTPITASEMVAMLDRNDVAALAFLEDITGAALRVVGLKASTSKST